MAQEMFSSKLTLLIGFILGVCVFGSIVGAVSKSSPNNRFAAALPSMKNDAFKQRVMRSLKQVSLGNEHFSLEFLNQLSRSELKNDFIASPFSIWSLLLLLTEGADGKTYEQLQNVLGLPEDLSYLRMSFKYIQKALNVNTSGIEVDINQSLFTDINRPINNDFSDKLEGDYNADQEAVNFYDAKSASDKINRYVSEKTRGKINNIVDADDLRDAQLVLISTLFFHGKWKVPFDVQETMEMPFFDETGKKQGTVNMMHQRGQFSYNNIAELQSQALELPYGDKEHLSMIILLPNEGTLITTLFGKLPSFGIENLLSQLQKHRKTDDEDEDNGLPVFLPRFSITSDFTLNSILEQMNITDIFDARKSNLSKISSQLTYVSRIIHKAQIDVNEVGTVAAAVTGAVISNKMAEESFTANRPFVFLIVDKNTNTLLFCGQVRNPGKVDFKPL